MDRFLVCKREDPYCIDTLQMVTHPKIDEIVEVEEVREDEDGVWLCLVGYDEDMFDANCFRPLDNVGIKQEEVFESLTIH